MNIAHRLSSTRPNRRLAALFALTLAALMLAALTLLPSIALAQSPPATPSSVTVSRADGTVTASGYAVSGATKYHITYTTDNGASWHAPVSNHTNWTSGSITFNADNSKTYIIGVRAGNDNGWSGWRNSASSGPYIPPQPTPTPTPEPTATPTPAPQPPSAVASVSLTRADGTVTANWNAVSGATHYHVTYTVSGSGNWLLAALNHTDSSIGISGVDNAKTYIVGVRAGNADGWSGWVNSPAAGPYTPEPTPTPTPEPTATPTPEPTATPTPEPTATPVPAPARPTGLSATAGDGSVTLAWNDPADSTITGYEYQTRWAGVAWSAWTAIASSDADTTSHIVTGLTNGKEYRYKIRAVNSGGSSKPAPQSSPWYVAATPQVPPPPAAPSNVAVNPSEDSLSITWDAVSDATGYDIRAKAEGASDWHDVASNVTGTSYTYTTSSTMDYIGVRARNANGVSAWSDVSSAPSEDWLTVVTQHSVRSRGASAQSVQAQSQLAAPASITVWRENAAYQRKIDVSWSAVSGASGYNVACSDKNGWHWWHCGSTTSGSTTQVTVTQNQFGERLDMRFYKIAVRAVTSNASEASAWKWSADTAYVIGELRNLTHSRSAGQITLSWKPNFWTTGYKIYCDEFTSRGAIAYTLCATLTGQDDTATQHTVTIPHSSNSTYTIDDAKTYQIKIVSTNQWGANHMVAPHIYPIVKLSASNVGVTTATLTIANHSGDWYYKANAVPDDTCQGPVSGASKDLTGLSAHTDYDYSAYSDSTCTTANELATAARFTTLSSVSNLTSTSGGDSDITSTRKQAVAFSISSTAASSDYILKTVTVPLKRVRSGTGSLTLTLHPMQGTGTYSSTSQPSGTAVSNTTISGTVPTSSSYVNTVFTCSGNGCKLERGKTYFVKATVTGSVQYAWNYASTETEVSQPSNNGWSIGNDHYQNNESTWASWDEYNLAEFVFEHAPAPTLSSSNLTPTNATLTLNHYNDGNWYYQADKTPHDTCQGPVSASIKRLRNLVQNTTYTYTAYSDNLCTTANEIAAAPAFTTPYPSISSLGSTLAGGKGIGDAPQAIAFTTGSNTNGYVLKNVDLRLKNDGGSQGLVVTLRAMRIPGNPYSTTSAPATSALTTLSGTAPTSASFTNTTFTCSGSGCSLSANTTYFVVVELASPSRPSYSWAYATTQTETEVPSGSGWGIEYGHSKPDDEVWQTHSTPDYRLAKFFFTTTP